MSIDEMVTNLYRVRQDSDELAKKITVSSQTLARQSNDIWATTRGSQSGSDAALNMKSAAESLSRSVYTLRTLCKDIDSYIAQRKR
jgi:hypothetical protein